MAGIGRMERRTWKGRGHAHLEVRALHLPGYERLARDLEAALERLGGVHWAEVNAVIGRVVVSFDEEEVDLGRLVDVLGAVEKAHHLEDVPFPQDSPEHPADVEPLQRNLIGLGADLAGLGLSLAGGILRVAPLPAELSAALSLVDNLPRLRRVLEDHFGHPAVELSLALSTAVSQALTQGPLGLAVDAAHRASLCAEIEARRRAFSRREPELCPRRVPSRPAAVDLGERPVTLRRGPIEAYSDGASLAAMPAFAVALAASGNPRRAANVLLAGNPKPARRGRDAFASQLGRMLSRRDVVVMDASVLRRLDRIDTFLLDARVLLTGRRQIGEVFVPVSSRFHNGEARRRALGLFDGAAPAASRRRKGWRLASLSELKRDLPSSFRPALRSLGKGKREVVGLVRRDELVALADVVPELDPLASALVERLRQEGSEVVVAGRSADVATMLGIEEVTAGGPRCAESVRELQADGRGVAFVSGQAHGALAAADCGIGVLRRGAPAPWGADVICGPSLDDVCFLVESVRVARGVSRRASQLSLVGSGVGGAWAAVGPRRGADRRAQLAVNSAALAAQASGTWSAYCLRHTPEAVPETPPEWQALEADDVLESLGSSAGGLSSCEARARRQKEKSQSELESFAEALVDELANPLTPILALGAALSAAVGSASDAALVGGVVVANSAIGSLQRLRTERSIRRLEETRKVTATTRRDGSQVRLQAGELVTGDVVELAPGELVPADCRIVATQGCEVDESSLTGESVPVRKSADPSFAASVVERSSMLYEGTTVVTGTAAAVVVATGAATEVGRSLAGTKEAPESGVESRLKHLTTATAPLTLASGAAVSGLSMLRGRSLAESVGSGVGLTVAAVPEGLPLLATVAQEAAAHRLSRRGAIVRNPRTIEALGRVDMLCFDKTGTLTEGRIGLQSVSDGESEQMLGKLDGPHRAVLAAALRATPDERGAQTHPTDQAVLRGAAEEGVIPGEGADSFECADELPFEPARGFHAVLGRTSAGCRLTAKGAPEVLIPRCRTWRRQDGEGPLDRRRRRQLEVEVERLAGNGLRILAVAERAFSEEGSTESAAELRDEAVQDLSFVGFLALADMVRPQAAAAVDTVRRAGVQVAMVTGDHPATAEAIARDLGILNGGRLIVGTEIDELSDGELQVAVADATVFARITPAQKVRIVEAYQRAGRVVAMTGDGANDAAAIRLAHAGVALGARGTPAARAAADVVVTDDRIETIVDAIVEGRAMWASVRDALAILLGGNLGEVAFTVAGTALSGASPLSARQLILVNLLTDMLPAMTIALRPPKGRDPASLLGEGPDASLGSALRRDIAVRALATGSGATAAWLAARATGSAARARTVGLVALVAAQLGQTALVGGTSPLAVGATAVSAATLVGIVQTPVVSEFFGCRPIGPVGWSIGLGSAAIATAGSVAVPRALLRLRGREAAPETTDRSRSTAAGWAEITAACAT
jgi:cation-transporting ATPase I